MNRRRFLKAAGSGLLLPPLAHAGLITQSGPRHFTDAGAPFAVWRSATFEFGANGSSAANATDGVSSVTGDTTISTTRAYSGTRSMQCSIAPGTSAMGGVITFLSTRNGGVVDNNQEFWCRFRCYIPSSWSIGTGDGGMKFFRWRTYTTGQVPVASSTMQLWGGGPNPTGLRTEKEGGTPDTRLFTPAGGWNDRWVTFEFYLSLRNDTGGILRSWVDGVLRGEVTGVNTAGSSTWTSLYLMFLDYFNNGATQNQTMWIDDIEIAWSGAATPAKQDAVGNVFMGA